MLAVQQDEIPVVSENTIEGFNIPANLIIGDAVDPNTSGDPNNTIDHHANVVDPNAPVLVDPNANAVAPTPNDDKYPQFELSAYRWQQNGRKITKKADTNKTVRRQHWRCSNWDKPTKELGCKAKFRIDIVDGKPGDSEPIKSEALHNHLPPPDRGRVDLETQLQMSVRPTKREKNNSISPVKEEDAQYLPPAKRQCVDTPTKADSRQWDAITSVMRLSESYGDLIRKLDIAPAIHGIFASPEGVAELVKSTESVFVSYENMPFDLTLVVFSVLAGEEEVDVLWMISNSSANYENMLQYVVDITEGRFKPMNVVITGPPSLRDSFSKVFPLCNVLSPVAPPGSPSSLALSVPPQVTPHSTITAAILSCLGRSPVQ